MSKYYTLYMLCTLVLDFYFGYTYVEKCARTKNSWMECGERWDDELGVHIMETIINM